MDYSWHLWFDTNRWRADFSNSVGPWRSNCVGCEWNGQLHYLSGPEESGLSVYSAETENLYLYLSPQAANFGFLSVSTHDSALEDFAAIIKEINSFDLAVIPLKDRAVLPCFWM